MQKNFISKTTSESRAIFTHATLPTDLNEGGTVYGAKLLEWADNLSAVVAIKHRRGSVTTAGFNSFEFINPIKFGDFIHGSAFISGVGKSSMEIFVKFVGEDSVSGKRYLAAMGFVTYAALKLKEGESLAKILGESKEEIDLIKTYEERYKVTKERLKRNKEIIKSLNI